jgi:phospholipid/cholesterol/gamma-HCH transport system substrate-binding protein
VQGDPNAPQPSFATVGSKGMLGDQLIDVSVGHRSFEEWNPDVPLPISNAGDLMGTVTRTLGRVSSAVTEIQGTASNLRRATEPLADQQFTQDLQTIAHNLATLTTVLSEGEGALPRLINDPESGRDLDQSLDAIRRASEELARAAADVHAITSEVRNGDGSAHELVYGDSGARAVSSIGDAAGEVALMLRAVRTGDGTAHDLIYENSADQMIANLTQATDDVAHITGEIRAGRGTVGGLVMDPSIYEDVKRLVGDLQRNEILRALVRYSIRRDEAREHTDVQESE